MCPPASHGCVGVNDSWIMQIILWLLDDAPALTGRRLPRELYLTFLPLWLSPPSLSCSLPVFSLIQLLTVIIPVSLPSMQRAAHGGANDAFLNPASAFCWSFLCHLSFFVYHVLKVSVLLERISASYQRDSLMPTSLLCLPAANYHLDQGGFLTASCESPEKDCKTKAELKLNSNEGPKKGHACMSTLIL